MQNPWDQQPNESSKSFSYFASYRDMGLRRSLRKLACKISIHLSSLAEISKKHDWQKRVLAWDGFLDKESQLRQVSELRLMKKRQITLALKAQKAASRGLKRLLKDMKSGDNSVSLKPEGLSKLLDIGCRLERLNRDEPEQNLEILGKQNFENLSLEELEVFKGLLAKSEAAIS